MDTKKIGKFLKELRKDKGITQEQLAEYMHVSGRTVSRWETGMNLPDITIPIELSDFYEISIREILDGEREEQNMEQEKAETILKVAEYSQEENKRIISRGRILFIFGFIVSLVNLIVEWLDLEGEGAWYNLADFIRGFIDGFALVIMLIGVLYTSNRLGKIEEIKRKILKKA